MVILAPGQAAATQESDAVDKIFERWNTTNTPGAVVGVVRNGDLLYSQGYGVADLDTGAPLTPDSEFYIASTSKQFTAAAIALAAAQRTIDLDTSVRRYVNALPAYCEGVTLRHMVHHTSGIPDYLPRLGKVNLKLTDPFGPEAVLAILHRVDPAFEPGARFAYSNSGYALLAEAIIGATGVVFSDFCEAKLFNPLGMDHTYFDDGRRLPRNPRAKGYSGKDGRYREIEKHFTVVGDGGLMTTVRDLAKWDRAFYEGLPGMPDFAEVMYTRGVRNDGEELDYAYGLRHETYRHHSVVSHGGSLQGWATEMMRFPDLGYTFIVLCNLPTMVPSKLTRRMADIYLKDEFTSAEEAAAAPEPRFITVDKSEQKDDNE